MEWASAAFEQIVEFVVQWNVLLYTLAGLVGVLGSISVARVLRAGNTRKKTDRAIGILRSKIAEKQKVVDNPSFHATIVDRQNIVFSIFTLGSGVLFYVLEDQKLDGVTSGGFPLELIVSTVAAATTAFAIATLVGKWFWSRPFLDFDTWKQVHEAKIEALQRRGLPQRATLTPTKEESREYEELLDHEEEQLQVAPRPTDLAETAPQAPPPNSVVLKKTGDRFGTFLNSRKDVHLVLAPHVDDGQGNRPWRIGTVSRVGDAGFGFLTERVVSNESKNGSAEGDEFYFNVSNICNAVPADVGDEAFFISVAGHRPSGRRKRPAYLVCLRNKPCRAIVRTVFSSGKGGFVEITDGSDNFASVLAIFDVNALQIGETIKEGDLIVGTVRHNNLGLTLAQANVPNRYYQINSDVG